MFNLLCVVCLIVLIANWTLSSNVSPSAMFALVNDLIVRIVRSTKPVSVCEFGVHLMRSLFSSLQNFLYSLLLKQLPLSVLMHRGVPLSLKYFVKNFKMVRVSVFLQTCAVGHLRKRSMATKIHTSPRVFDLNGPAKSNWISWFDSGKISRLFFSVDGLCVIMFLPAALQLGHFSAFSCISRCMPGHQKASASWSNLAAEVWPWCSMATMVVRMFSGITILSL